MVLRPVQRLANVAKVDDDLRARALAVKTRRRREALAGSAGVTDHALRAFPHHLRRLHEEALAISGELGVVGHQQRVHPVEQLLVPVHM